MPQVHYIILFTFFIIATFCIFEIKNVSSNERSNMNFTCGKCSHTQKLVGFHFDLDVEEPHRIWGAVCEQCEFSGKSRVTPQVWGLLRATRRLQDIKTPLVGLGQPQPQRLGRIEAFFKQVGNIISGKLGAILRS